MSCAEDGSHRRNHKTLPIDLDKFRTSGMQTVSEDRLVYLTHCSWSSVFLPWLILGFGKFSSCLRQAMRHRAMLENGRYQAQGLGLL
ncbi:hypothetical protein RRG08_049911 [Elysia crispata]|uniref:Uncharacterized protein n=1 Tax=Elysia crispata TaxID=231223 RepID=A0AAE1CQ33_9GAST|nr:hypothetical protein RRG08_049911 [Elysia crispata]